MELATSSRRFSLLCLAYLLGVRVVVLDLNVDHVKVHVCMINHNALIKVCGASLRFSTLFYLNNVHFINRSQHDHHQTERF